jgi:ferric iron reductase protein FhuF
VNTALQFDPAGEITAIRFCCPRYHALASDSAAAHPDATIVTDLAALRTRLRCGLETHLGEVIAQLCAATGCKPRGLWLNVSDSIASTLSWLMQAEDPATPCAQIEAEFIALARVPGSPLDSGQIGLIHLTHGERTMTFADRATCCYWHKTAGGDYCSTCPKRTAADRRARLLESMAVPEGAIA